MAPHSYLCGGPTAHSGPVARLPKCSTMSRPTTFSESLGAEICDRISEGEGLVSICRSEHMPHRATVHRWLSGETASAPDSFRDRYVEARVLQGDAYAERALDTGAVQESGALDRVRTGDPQLGKPKKAPEVTPTYALVAAGAGITRHAAAYRTSLDG